MANTTPLHGTYADPQVEEGLFTEGHDSSAFDPSRTVRRYDFQHHATSGHFTPGPRADHMPAGMRLETGLREESDFAPLQGPGAGDPPTDAETWLAFALRLVKEVAPWAAAAGLAVVGTVLFAKFALPLLAAQAAAWGLASIPSMVASAMTLAWSCLTHCVGVALEFATTAVMLQGQVALGLFAATAELASMPAMVAAVGSVLTFVESAAAALVVGVAGKAAYEGGCKLYEQTRHGAAAGDAGSDHGAVAEHEAVSKAGSRHSSTGR